jgi:flagellar biosynthetic protein FliP
VVSGRIGLRVKGLGFREQLFISVSQFLSFSVSQKKIILFFLFLLPAFGADAVQIPTVNLSLSAPDEPTQLVNSLNFIFIITLLILSPAIVFVMTSFLRLVVVFSFLKQAMGTQQMPPSQFMVSLALILTFFIMEPVATKAYEVGIKPYMEKKIGYEVAIENAVKPFKKFMLNNTREKDLALFYRIRNLENPKTIDDVPLTVIIPAFMISELKTAFEIGFLIYLPFLVIDMVVSSVLMSMGMMMLPPVMISLPFKLLIFVLIDGWNLLVGNLVESFK